MSGIRTYNSNVLVGNWYEDNVLREDSVKDFMARKENGELVSQKFGSLFQSASSATSLSVATDGLLHIGDTVQLRNPGADARLVQLSRCNARPATNLCMAASLEMLTAAEPPEVAPCAGVADLQPTARSVLMVKSCDGAADGAPVRYGQAIQLVTHPSLGKIQYLSSDRASFSKVAKKSRHQAVYFGNDDSYQTQWRVEIADPQWRLESEGNPLPVNTNVLLKHMKTNEALAIEASCLLPGLNGMEYEISTHTYLDDHKAERDVNHWMFATAEPYRPQQAE